MHGLILCTYTGLLLDTKCLVMFLIVYAFEFSELELGLRTIFTAEAELWIRSELLGRVGRRLRLVVVLAIVLLAIRTRLLLLILRVRLVRLLRRPRRRPIVISPRLGGPDLR